LDLIERSKAAKPIRLLLVQVGGLRSAMPSRLGTQRTVLNEKELGIVDLCLASYALPVAISSTCLPRDVVEPAVEVIRS
jgi:hypothetical protein